MITIGMFLLGLILFGLVLSVIVIVGRILVTMIATMGEPECSKCESYDDGLDFCEYYLECEDCHFKCDNFKRRKVC